MSRSTCITCGRSVRDFDEQPHGQTTKLPDHGCAKPLGDWPWNDGKHAWSDIAMDYIQITEAA